MPIYIGKLFLEPTNEKNYDAMNIIIIASAVIIVAYFCYAVVFYISVGIIQFVKERNYKRVIRNIGIIAVVCTILHFIGYFRWLRSAVRTLWYVFN